MLNSKITKLECKLKKPFCYYRFKTEIVKSPNWNVNFKSLFNIRLCELLIVKSPNWNVNQQEYRLSPVGFRDSKITKLECKYCT